MNKTAAVIILVLVVLIGGWWLMKDDTPNDAAGVEGELMEENTNDFGTQNEGDIPAGARDVVTPGSYTVVAEESTVNWAGKKPLLEGYINSGSLAVESGSITVTENDAEGSFTIDMDTLSVSETPTKPGQENTLEGHLKGERWFNVAAYPEAVFTITSVTPRADSETTYTYDVTGELTMKGTTDTLSFPAMIYLDDLGRLRADASFEFDRTKWGITSGSGSFFDDLADNVIDDMVALSFSLVAVEE